MSVKIQLPSAPAVDDRETLEVLVVIDDNELLDRVMSAMADMRLTVRPTTVPTIEEAKELLSAVECVVAELVLPDGEAFDLIDHTPVVVVTQEDTTDVGLQALRKGAADFLAQDEISPSVLRRCLQAAVERGLLQEELRRSNERLNELALHDPRSGLLNRRGIDHMLKEVPDTPGHLVAVALDGLHAAGAATEDMLIAEVGLLLERAGADNALAGHPGGERFILMIQGRSKADAQAICAVVSKEIDDIAEAALGPGVLTLRAGSVPFAEKPAAISTLMALSDRALPQSSDAHPNRDEAEQRIEQLRGLLEMGNPFRVVQQAIIALEDQQPIGVELFTRARHDAMLLPSAFFEVARQADRLTEVDHLCLQACLGALPKVAQIHINLFPDTLLAIPLDEVATRFAHPEGTKLVIELSEHDMPADPGVLEDHITTLKECGVLFALDDVGEGKGSLEALVLLDPDYMKIDSPWVNGIEMDFAKRLSMERLIRLARALEIELIAEGIDNEGDMNVLRRLGVRLGQGYLWGTPDQPE